MDFVRFVLSADSFYGRQTVPCSTGLFDGPWREIIIINGAISDTEDYFESDISTFLPDVGGHLYERCNNVRSEDAVDLLFVPYNQRLRTESANKTFT